MKCLIRIVEWRKLDGKWARDQWKMQVSYNNGQDWEDVPVVRLPDVESQSHQGD